MWARRNRSLDGRRAAAARSADGRNTAGLILTCGAPILRAGRRAAVRKRAVGRNSHLIGGVATVNQTRRRSSELGHPHDRILRPARRAEPAVPEPVQQRARGDGDPGLFEHRRVLVGRRGGLARRRGRAHPVGPEGGGEARRIGAAHARGVPDGTRLRRDLQRRRRVGRRVITRTATTLGLATSHGFLGAQGAYAYPFAMWEDVAQATPAYGNIAAPPRPPPSPPTSSSAA